MKIPSRTDFAGFNVNTPFSFALILTISELLLELTLTPITFPPEILYGTQLPSTSISEEPQLDEPVEISPVSSTNNLLLFEAVP